MRTISIAYQKGGCGKTTTAINLSACLAFSGQKVLLIDLDPQGHSTMGLNINPDELKKTMYEVLCGSGGSTTTLDDVTLPIAENFYFVPANINLSTFEQELSGIPSRETKLKESIRKLYRSYDYILIDGSPGIGCPVIASITGVHLVVLITELTLSGIHDIERVISLTNHFNI